MSVRRQVRVLVVDDDEKAWLDIRELLAGIAELECIPEWASTYDAGIEQIKALAPDVCLLDYQLGGNGGVALLRRVVEVGSRFPIIAVSDEDSVEAVVSAMQAGATNYLLRKDLAS